MILEFSLFGYPIWSLSMFHAELQTEYDDEVIHNASGNFEIAPRTYVPFGFSTGEEYEEEYEDEDTD